MIINLILFYFFPFLSFSVSDNFYTKKEFEIFKPYLQSIFDIHGLWPKTQKLGLKKSWRKHCALRISFICPVWASEDWKVPQKFSIYPIYTNPNQKLQIQEKIWRPLLFFNFFRQLLCLEWAQTFSIIRVFLFSWLVPTRSKTLACL